MQRYIFILSALLLLPSGAFAADITYERSLAVSTTSPENAYFLGADVTVAGSSLADLFAAGVSVLVSAPVEEDGLFVGGTVRLRAPIEGDARLFGGSLHVNEPVGGDLVMLGGTIEVTGTPANLWALGGTVRAMNGSGGPTALYGSKVTLKGSFDGDVRVVATDILIVEEGTSIAGTLRYNAPQEAIIGKETVIEGGIEYTGKSFLPTQDEARTFAFLGAGVFLLVRLFAALIAAGLLAGLFPRFAQLVATETVFQPLPRFILITLLGFSVAVATPALILLLLLSFAGAAVAFVIAAAYILLMLVSYLAAGILAGAVLAKRVFKREFLSWRHAVLGTLVLFVIGTVPVIGSIVFCVFAAASVGAITVLAYRLAFSKEESAE